MNCRPLVFAAVLLTALLSESARSEEPRPAAPPEPDQATLEKEFAEKLSGAVFTGSYSLFDGKQEKPAQMEKYTITKVTKQADNRWLFAARMQFGSVDATVPLLLHVKWAGDTPVITLTNLTIPGLGTFTSRVLVYGERYAGTWQHDKVGGHLWGRIEKLEKPAGDANAAESQ
ncbi:MAG: hypothetical protein ACT4QC_01375 [Planctomycetaceae bacterium]